VGKGKEGLNNTLCAVGKGNEGGMQPESWIIACAQPKYAKMDTEVGPHQPRPVYQHLSE
jgi:hypothetical protein